MLRRLSRALSLTPEQNEQLDTIMRESRSDEGVLELLEPELRAEFRKTRDESAKCSRPNSESYSTNCSSSASAGPG